ncbi:MAG: threonine/serine exporter family protein [Corynebacterium sp.]|nr:threonine/serine exporter family protein [Corynebacterium sp.]
MRSEEYRQMGIEADAVLRLGMMLMGAGTSGYRVVRGMKRAARALGFDRLDATVGVTLITCTFHRGSEFRTVVARQQSPAIDASRIEALEDLNHNRLTYGMTAADLNAALDDIENYVVKRWSWWVLSLAAAIACASFALLNILPWAALPLVAVAAFAGQWMRHTLHSFHVQQIGGVIAGALTASVTYWLLTLIVGALGWALPADLSAGYIAAVLFLIPGFPLFSSLIDLARFDFDAGMARLTYALTIVTAATLTVSIVSWATRLDPEPQPVPMGELWLLEVAVASFLGVAGFAFLFNSSRRMVLVAAAIGTVANLIRFIFLELGAPVSIAALIGGLGVGLLGAVTARLVRLPRITMTIPAAVIMVPGAAMFRAVYFLSIGDMNGALTNIGTSALIIASIGAGLVTARLLSDKDWTFGHLIDFSYRP